VGHGGKYHVGGVTRVVIMVELAWLCGILMRPIVRHQVRGVAQVLQEVAGKVAQEAKPAAEKVSAVLQDKAHELRVTVEEKGDQLGEAVKEQVIFPLYACAWFLRSKSLGPFCMALFDTQLACILSKVYSIILLRTCSRLGAERSMRVCSSCQRL
jgi:hypothetical protein